MFQFSNLLTHLPFIIIPGKAQTVEKSQKMMICSTVIVSFPLYIYFTELQKSVIGTIIRSSNYPDLHAKSQDITFRLKLFLFIFNIYCREKINYNKKILTKLQLKTKNIIFTKFN